jgi:hypothetical protein
VTQLALDLRPERVYGCCGRRAPGLHERPSKDRPFPHADDCPNPNVGPWVDRATGCMIRRLHCVAADGSCPHGGRPPEDPYLVDPHGGRCCLELRERADDQRQQ